MLVAKNERGQLVRASDAQRTRGTVAQNVTPHSSYDRAAGCRILLTGLNRVVSWHKGE